jgi:cold shock protein
MLMGTIKFFNLERGFGFLVPDDGSADLYVHWRGCFAGYLPTGGDRVEYRLGSHTDGKPRAEKVAPLLNSAELPAATFGRLTGE